METFNIVAVDPGTTTIGVSVYTINVKDLSIVNIESVLINTAIRFKEEDLTKDLLVRLDRLYNRMMELIRHYDPKILSIEAGFINRLRPAAYGPLSQSIMAIELAARTINPLIKIFKFAPKTIKKVTTRGGAADKDDVLLGVLAIPEITRHINPYTVSEHEVDSLAINYTMLDYIRNNEAILYIAY